VGRGAESRRLIAGTDGLPAAEVLRARAALLAGTPVSCLDAVHGRVQWTHGSRALLGSARRAGYRCGVVTGGIAQVAERLVDGLGLDFLAANRLETADGRLTGRIVGEVVDRGGRARALVRFAEAYGVPLSQTVAVGCGPAAAEVISLAGLGVAVDTTRQPADGEPTRSAHLDALLFVLGLRPDDTDTAAPTPGRLPTPTR
jgi:phosphoserine phosphatase